MSKILFQSWDAPSLWMMYDRNLIRLYTDISLLIVCYE